MKQIQSNVTNDDDSETEEVVRCMTCGAVIGYYGHGSIGTMKCPSCKEDFRFNFKEDCPILKRITYRVKAKATT